MVAAISSTNFTLLSAVSIMTNMLINTIFPSWFMLMAIAAVYSYKKLNEEINSTFAIFAFLFSLEGSLPALYLTSTLLVALFGSEFLVVVFGSLFVMLITLFILDGKGYIE